MEQPPGSALPAGRRLSLPAACLLGALAALLPTTESGAQTGPGQRGTLVAEVRVDPSGGSSRFRLTGVPDGTVAPGAPLEVRDMDPGTYTATLVDPAPDFDVTGVRCDDGASPMASDGNPASRTAVFNLDPGERVTCTWTVTRRGSVVTGVETVPPGLGGTFLLTGVPWDTLSPGDRPVTPHLAPGTYTSTMADPAPDFDVTGVRCDDGRSPTASSGSAASRTAVINLDAGEQVTCTWTVTGRGSAVVRVETEPEGVPGRFVVTGVPTDTLATGEDARAPDLAPGTYSATLVAPAPDFEITEVRCDDQGSATASFGDPLTRTAVFNVDPAEEVTCTWVLEARTDGEEEEDRASVGSAGRDLRDPGAVDPFQEPGALDDFPPPDTVPPALHGTLLPRPGPWFARHSGGRLTCSGGFGMDMPPGPDGPGEIEVLQGGRVLSGTGVSPDGPTTLRLTPVPGILGRWAGVAEGRGEVGPVEMRYVWQVVTPEYIVGYLRGTATMRGRSCEVYQAYELEYTG